MIEKGTGFEFDDTTIRQAFIKKVYSILMLQLLVTFAVVAWMTYHVPTKQFAHENMGLLVGASIIYMVLVIAMFCCSSVRRKTPINYIFLFAFTIAMAIILGYVSSVMEEKYVLLALGITAVICFSLTAFAFQTKLDFTGIAPYLFVCLILLMLFGVINLFWNTKTTTLIYSACGTLLFSFFLIFDTQLMIGGKHKYSISPEDYIQAALNLYLDIIFIFLYIVQFIGAYNQN